MSKVSNVNILIPNVSTDGVGYILYYLKETLKGAGWKILAASDGTTYVTYANGITTADQITSPSSGSNGMNNPSSWFRITDPESSREFVFMRGNSATNAIIKYSRSTKFTGGSPNATTLPTTGVSGDGVVLIGSSLDSSTTSQLQSAALLTNTTTSARLHIISDNSSTNNTFPWYLYVFQAVSDSLLCLYAQEAVAVGSCSDLDQDPSYFFICSNTTDLFTNAHNTLYSGSSIKGWHKYGLTNSSFQNGTCCSYMTPYSSTSLYYQLIPASGYAYGIGDNPYDGKDYSIPFLITTGTHGGYSNIKGFSTNIKFSCKTFQNRGLSLINRGQNDAGLYIGNGSASVFIFPWASENIDLLTSG